MACIIFMIINIYGLYYYYYGSYMDGAFDVYLWLTYCVWVLIPSLFGHSESIGAAGFQFRAVAGEIWVFQAFYNKFAMGNYKNYNPDIREIS